MPIWRFQVTPRPELPDTVGRKFRQSLLDFGIQSVAIVGSARVFLVELNDQIDDQESVAGRIAAELLVDDVVESCLINREGQTVTDPPSALAVEVHLKPGVMDNTAQSTLHALADMGIQAESVRTARRFELSPIPNDRDLPRISKLVGNACIEDVFIGTPPIKRPPTPPRYEFRLVHVPIRDLDEAGLDRLSREGHLFLSREEMKAIQSYYRKSERDPTDLELETLAQTWSEHCVHKTLKSGYLYRGIPFPSDDSNSKTDTGATVTREYDNLLRDTIARATRELMAEKRGPECLSVFVDNAGVIAFDDDHGIAFKVETHNHPSAIEPYGGASTGVGGVIRDVLGCGLGAKPIANTDVFCVAPPDWPIDRIPRGIIHPRTTLGGIVAGVRDYGNRMGIPTVNGAVHFDPRYLGNPLVYCGCVGLIRRNRIEKAARPGDFIVVIGGRTGRDGVHGATFSSAELTDTHSDEFAHAVQIGNAIEEKKVLDLVLLAGGYQAPTELGGESRCLFSAITDCGAGGLSSAIGEMGADTGVEVDLEKVPLKYSGLRYDEIWISEAQERMVLSLPPENADAFLAMARAENVEATIIGRFTDTMRLVVRYSGIVVGDIDMALLHDGIPRSKRNAVWMPEAVSTSRIEHSIAHRLTPAEAARQLSNRLADPNVASKHWVFRQYDHEVQSGSVTKPWVGDAEGPTDAAVIRPKLNSNRAIAIGCGLAPAAAQLDPYWMTIAAIDEAVRNIVCVGGNPQKTAILDNFCWPASDDPVALGALVRSCQACYDAAKAYGLPFISGKDSLNNVFAMSAHDAAMVLDVIRSRDPRIARAVEDEMHRRPNKLAIPYTLLISAISIMDSPERRITSMPVFDGAGSRDSAQSASSQDEITLHYIGTRSFEWDNTSLAGLSALHKTVADLIRSGAIISAHDVSDGGIAAAVAEMAMTRHCQTAFTVAGDGPTASPLALPPSAYIVQARSADALGNIASINGMHVIPVARLKLAGSARDEFFAFINDPEGGALKSVDWSRLAHSPATVRDFRTAWREPLDW